MIKNNLFKVKYIMYLYTNDKEKEFFNSIIFRNLNRPL